MIASAAGRPLGLAAVGIEHGVALLDVVQGLEDGVAGDIEAVAEHPLDLADPHRDPGQLRGIGVELDAEHVLGPDHGEGPG